MRKNPIGDLILGTTGGALCSYFLFGAALVLLTGDPLGLGPRLPVVAASDAGPLLYLTVRLVQAFYHVGLACLAFLGFRFMQEMLRGHAPAQAFKEATELPRLLY